MSRILVENGVDIFCGYIFVDIFIFSDANKNICIQLGLERLS